MSEKEFSSEDSSEYECTEKSPPHRRDEWMSEPLFVAAHAKCVTGGKNRNEKNDHSSRELFEVPGRSDRELNPYWRNGGCGLPNSSCQSASQNFHQIIDVDWLRNSPSKKFETVKERKQYSETIVTSNDAPAETTALKINPKICKDSNINTRFENYTSIGNCGWRKMVKLETDAGKMERGSDVPSNTCENVSLTEADMNSLASKILKAKLLKNDKLVKELTKKLEKTRKFRQDTNQGTSALDRTVLLTYTNARGVTLPVRGTTDNLRSERKHKNYETHVDGKRVRYFEDDNKYSLTQMYEKEMSRSTADHNAEFVRLFAKGKKSKNNEPDDWLMEQTTSDRICEENDLQNAISKQKRTDRALDSCLWCLSNQKIQKHLIVSTRSKCYLSLPNFQPLTEGHCVIAPTYHSTCSTLVDEDVWEEILAYCKNLTNIFRIHNQDVVFFETAMNFKQYPHMRIQCVPMPFESGHLAPIYFKKAILESEKEWAQNKKLVDVNKFNVKRVIPRGLPYFLVNFGMDYGFAHVIEDENDFPKNFAQEIIGGMLDLDHYIWKKQRTDDFENQCKRVNKFKRMCTGTELLSSQ